MKALIKHVLQLKRTPVTVACLSLSVLAYLLVYFDHDLVLVRYLSFTDIDTVGGHRIYTLPKHQYWRLLTPLFLHFSLMHIAFNSLWLWELGRRVEFRQGSGRMLVLMVVIGVGSNVGQYFCATLSKHQTRCRCVLEKSSDGVKLSRGGLFSY